MGIEASQRAKGSTVVNNAHPEAAAGAHQGKPLETHRGSFIIIKAAAVAADSFAERKRPVFQGCARAEHGGIRAA